MTDRLFLFVFISLSLGDCVIVKNNEEYANQSQILNKAIYKQYQFYGGYV
jgi:hypothetical protein